MRTVLGAGLLLISGAAMAMDAHSFYTRATALKGYGAAAVVMPEFKKLKAEAEAADKAVRAENAREKAKGKALFCAPAKIDMTPDQLLAELRRIPVERRKAMTVRAAWREIAIRKYPC